jgi:outer membrane biosynthesis protein TonB
MQKPLTSFVFATLVWLVVLSGFSLSIFKKSPSPKIALEIDAQMIGEVAEEKKPAKKSNIKTPEIDKSSDLKTAKKALQHDHHFVETAKKLAPIFNPLPQIPDDLREEAFASEAIARFYISNEGAVLKVELIKPCANPKLNFLLLKSLRKWRFANGSTESTQDIRVNFLVK